MSDDSDSEPTPLSPPPPSRMQSASPAHEEDKDEDESSCSEEDGDGDGDVVVAGAATTPDSSSDGTVHTGDVTTLVEKVATGRRNHENDRPIPTSSMQVCRLARCWRAS